MNHIEERSKDFTVPTHLIGCSYKNKTSRHLRVSSLPTITTSEAYVTKTV